MKYIKLLIVSITVLAIESLVLAALMAAFITKPEKSYIVTVGVLFLFFMAYKAALELWALLLILSPTVSSKKVITKEYVHERGGLAIVITFLLVFLAVDDARGIDIFLMSPILYPISIVVSFLLYKKYFLNSLFIHDKNV